MNKEIAIHIKEQLICGWIDSEWADGLGFGCSDLNELIKYEILSADDLKAISVLDEIINHDNLQLTINDDLSGLENLTVTFELDEELTREANKQKKE